MNLTCMQEGKKVIAEVYQESQIHISPQPIYIAAKCHYINKEISSHSEHHVWNQPNIQIERMRKLVTRDWIWPNTQLSFHPIE